MTLPVFKTVFDNIDRTWRAWPVLWHYVQAPALIVGLLGCAAVAVYLFTGDSTLFAVETVDGQERTSLTGWGMAFQFFFGYGSILLLLPFYVTWMRYVTAGPAGLQGRGLWQFGPLEWNVVIGVLLCVFYLFCIGVVVGLVGVIITVVGSFVGIKEPGGGVLALAAVTGIALYVWFLMIVTRATAAFLPMAFGQKLDIGRALRATRDFKWRVFATYILFAIAAAVPLLPIMLIVTALNAGDGSATASRPWLLFQMFQPFIFLPINVFFTAVAIAIYADIWRQPAANVEWPVPDFPLVAIESTREPPQS